MNIAALNPLNWFRKQETHSNAPASDSGQAQTLPQGHWSPLLSGYGPGMNLLEAAGEYQIELAVPGLSQADLSIELQGDQLLISGAQSRRQSVDVNGQQWSVARAGFFQRRLTLPADALPESLDAQLRNGLLTLTVKRDAGRPSSRRTITIH